MHVALRNVYRLSQLNSERASHFVLKRWKATAAPAVEDIEIINVKSFDEIPGARSLPLIGTAWTGFPIIGKLLI